MMRATFLCLLCCLSFTVTQAASPAQPSAPIQIIYTLDGTTLSTYNIDPLTLQPTLAGTFTVETSLYGWIYPSPNGHFLYRSEEHTSELQSLRHLVCRLLLE